MMSALKRVEIDPSHGEPRRFAGTLKSLVLPRPIAWVSSLSAAGIGNLAPHSYFTVASEDPPVVQFTSIGDKDSLSNIRETGEFVVNLASEPDFEAINATATDYPHEIDEFDAVGVERESAATVAPPRVASSPAAIECKLYDTIAIGNATVILGRVTHVAIAERVLRDERADVELLQPLARLGGRQWSLIGEVREIARIPYEGGPEADQP